MRFRAYFIVFYPREPVRAGYSRLTIHDLNSEALFLLI